MCYPCTFFYYIPHTVEPPQNPAAVVPITSGDADGGMGSRTDDGLSPEERREVQLPSLSYIHDLEVHSFFALDISDLSYDRNDLINETIN